MTQLSEQLIKIQKKNYRRNVEIINESLGKNPAIESYKRQYLYYLKKYQEISSKTELLKKIIASDLVFHGDYHTLKQSQRCILRILRDILDKRKVILCLEMFHGKNQNLIDEYMASKLTKREFLKKIEYKKKWPFNWNHWEPIIKLCKIKKIPIIGINTHVDDEKGNTNLSLKKRDAYSARVIVKALIRNPEKLIYVVDGDYHICPSHLPKIVSKLLKLLDVTYKPLVVYQNSVDLYWKLCKEKKEEKDVLKIDDKSYCIMNTMPANKVQSYLNWLEYSEDAYYPIHKEWEDEVFTEKGLTIQKMVTTISNVLGLELPENYLNKLVIYYPNDIYFMDFVYHTFELKNYIRQIKEKIKRDEGFLLQYTQNGEAKYLIYLTNSSLNMAAEEAAHFVNLILRGRLQKKLNSFDNFYRNTITECLGFFGSKLINEKRKAQSENLLRRFLGQIKKNSEFINTSDETIKIARCILQHLYLQRQTESPEKFKKKFNNIYKSKSHFPIAFSTQLGYRLGNKLYYAVKKGKFPITKIRQYFKSPFDKPFEAFNYYIEINRRVKKIKNVNQF